MALTTVSWVKRDPIDSTKLQAMCDNTTTAYNLANNAPRGCLAHREVKINQFSPAGSVWWDVPNLAISGISLEANRVIKVSAKWQGIASIFSPGVWAVQIQNTASGKVIAEAFVNCFQDWVVQGGGSTFAMGVTTSAATVGWKVSVKKIVGSDGGGSVTMWASDDGPAQLIVEDLGSTTNLQ